MTLYLRLLRALFMKQDVQSLTSPNEISSSPDRGATCSYRRGSKDRVTAVYLFHLLWRKWPSINILYGGWKDATLPPEIPVEKLVKSHGDIMNICKSQTEQLGRSVHSLSEFSHKLCTDRPPRTHIESDSIICCMYTTVSSWRWALDARNM